MTQDSASTGLIENEKLLRKTNERAQRYIKRDFSAKQRATIAMRFYCECAFTPCTERIELTEAEYAAIHAERDKFIVAKGHELSNIEKVVAKHESYYVIEKYALSS